MDSFAQNKNASPGSSKLFWVIMVVGLLLVGGLVTYFLLQPSPAPPEVRLENAIREGAEFDFLTKRIVVEPDLDYTEEATSPIGGLQMTLAGLVRNFSGKAIVGLEVVGSVVDQKGAVIKEKKMIVIPGRTTRLETSKTMPIRMVIDGFNKTDDRANIKWRITGVQVE